MDLMPGIAFLEAVEVIAPALGAGILASCRNDNAPEGEEVIAGALLGALKGLDAVPAGLRRDILTHRPMPGGPFFGGAREAGRTGIGPSTSWD